MTTPFQLFFIAIGIILAVQSVIKGAAVGTLPLGWFLAETSEEYSVYIWLGACYIFALVIIFGFLKDVSSNSTSSR